MLRFLKIFAFILGVLVVIGLATITTVDRGAVEQQDFYRDTFERLKATPWQGSEGEAWLAGWAKMNVTPPQPANLVGYSPRGPYEFVADSSFVKAITLSNGKTRMAWLNFELLIVHPALAKALEKGLEEAALPIDQLHFTATHTHSGMGGYMPGPLGKIAFGGYDQKFVDLLVEKSKVALHHAVLAEDTVQMSFKKTQAADFVTNRFVKDGPYDPFVRQIIFSRKDGKKAVFLTYSAHATCLNSKFMGLSGDYPKYLTWQIEKREVDFALFAAGTVGSHRPQSRGNTPDKIQEYAAALDSVIWKDTTEFLAFNSPRIIHSRLNLSLRDPHLRISDNLRIRPWLFDYLVGDTNAHLGITQLGNLLLVSSSGEISGVFYQEWEKLADQHGLKLIVTVFNGGYVGYITPDELYDEHYHEVRETNWYGPGNGKYFDDLIREIILRAGK